MKDKSHVHELLSAFADGELPPQQAKTVESHLSGCSECREHLSELRSLSKMLSGMPRKDLPPGFMQRLKARQLRQSDSEAETRRFPFFAWTPPVRAAAMALSALVVMFVAYEGLRSRPSLAPSPIARQAASIGDSGTLSAAAAREAAMRQDKKADLSALQASLKDRIAEKSLESGASGSSSQAEVSLGPKAAAFRAKTEALSRMAKAAAPVAPPALAGGSPLGEVPQPSYTNEELQAMIEAEKKRMGIIAMAPPQEDAFSSDDPMAGMARPDRLNNAAKQAPARLEGDTPAIITPTSLQAPSEAGRVALGPTVGPGTRTFSPVKASRGARVSDLLAVPGGGSSLAHEQAAPEEDSRAFGSLSATAARSRDELDRLWASLNIALPKPTVDFSRQMVVLVPPSEEDNSACDIVSVEEAGSSLLVRCRRHESSYAERPTAVSFRVVPAKDLPLKLEPFK